MSPWQRPDLFIVDPLPAQKSGWGDWTPPKNEIPEWADDEEKKKLFGIELAKGHNSPFQAACAVFEDSGHALWASINWINDAVALAARDLYLKTVLADATLLDKDQLAARILQFADSVTPNGYPALEPEIRLKSFELYAKIRGYLKDGNNNSSNFTFNEMKVVVVSSEKPQQESIAQASIEEEVIEAEVIEPLPLRIASVK